MHTHWTASCLRPEQAALRARETAEDDGPPSAGWWIAPLLLVGLSVWGGALYGLHLLLN